MKLNKKMQYAFLLTLYLCRSGRAALPGIAESLNLSEAFLSQVAQKLRKGGIVKVFKGPGGGYEINGDPTVKDIFDAVQPLSIISKKDIKDYPLNCMENRTMLQFVTTLTQAWTPLMKRRMRNVALEVATTDVTRFNRNSPSSQVN